MARITITEAANQGWASRPTIYRKIKSGDLSVQEEAGGRLIDVAELTRVFGEPKAKPKEEENPSTNDAVARTKLQDELEDALDRIELLEKDLRDARIDAGMERVAATREREKLIDIIDGTTKQLADLRTRTEQLEDLQHHEPPQPSKEPEKPVVRRSLAGWVFAIVLFLSALVLLGIVADKKNIIDFQWLAQKNSYDNNLSLQEPSSPSAAEDNWMKYLPREQEGETGSAGPPNSP